MKNDYSGLLRILVDKALSGHPEDIDFIMQYLNSDAKFSTTRYVDFALSLVENNECIARIENYLFYGSQIQRNYACLFLNRIGEWLPVKKAFELGLIDEIQAYSR